jgi:putative transposase
MKTTRKSDSQIMQILSQASSGVPVPELCREHGMSSATFYKWRGKVESYIYFYNYKRIHSAIGYMTPAQKMAELGKVA